MAKAAKSQDEPTTSAKTLQPASPSPRPAARQPAPAPVREATTEEAASMPVPAKATLVPARALPEPVEDDGPAPAQAPAHPRGAKKARVYPVEFAGYVTKDQNEQPVKVTETEEGGLKWEAYDPRDVPRAQRDAKAGKAREPNPHPTRRTRFFYRQEDAEKYRDAQGFRLHPPQEHRLKTAPVLATAKPEA